SSRSPEEVRVRLEAGHHIHCMVIDFLPERPTHPTTALALASGGSVPGQLRVRRLHGWVRGPSVRTRFVMMLEMPLTDEGARCAVEVFNRCMLGRCVDGIHRCPADRADPQAKGGHVAFSVCIHAG
ncbi:hypothetical protein VaNZ11_009843, partial [Volvox africanus]